jgi:hypothetical protein
MKTLSILTTVLLAGFLSGCRAPMRTDLAPPADEHAALLAVLAHMVAGADVSAQSICFVELGQSDIEQLRRDCGVRYQIFPIEMSEEHAFKRSGPGASEDVPEWGIRLKGTEKEGVRIQATVTRAHRDEAEATGSYQGRLWGSGWRFRLRYAEGTWRVVSSECIAAI